jgi:hypothetical protein
MGMFYISGVGWFIQYSHYTWMIHQYSHDIPIIPSLYLH